MELIYWFSKPNLKVFKFEKNVLKTKFKGLEFGRIGLKPPPKKPPNKSYNIKIKIKVVFKKEELHNTRRNYQ
jgi:hypothetical protein